MNAAVPSRPPSGPYAPPAHSLGPCSDRLMNDAPSTLAPPDKPSTQTWTKFHAAWKPRRRLLRQSPRTALMRAGCADRARPEKLLGHGRRTADRRWCARSHGCVVGSQHHVRVKHRHQGGEVTAARGGQERVDDRALAGGGAVLAGWTVWLRVSTRKSLAPGCDGPHSSS
jgi:hypothetical protein